MYSHTCCADYNLVQDYTLCCIAYTEWYYTKGVNCQIFTQKGINFLRSFWKNLHRTEKIYTGTACGACDKYEVWLASPVYVFPHCLSGGPRLKKGTPPIQFFCHSFGVLFPKRLIFKTFGRIFLRKFCFDVF